MNHRFVKHVLVENGSDSCKEKKCLDLNEEIAMLDYGNEQYPRMGRRKLAEHVSVGKTALSNILKDSKNLRKDYKFFKGTNHMSFKK